MTQLLLDDTALLGLTFLPMRWEADRIALVESEVPLVTTHASLYAYCTEPEDAEFGEVAPGWSYDAGSYGETLTAVRTAQTNFDLQLYAIDPDDLDQATVVETFLDETEIPSVSPPVAESLQENIRAYLTAQLPEEDTVTHSRARQVVDAMCDTIYDRAAEIRAELSEAVTVAPKTNTAHAPSTVTDIDDPIVEAFLSDAASLQANAGPVTIVTGRSVAEHPHRDVILEDVGAGLVHVTEVGDAAES